MNPYLTPPSDAVSLLAERFAMAGKPVDSSLLAWLPALPALGAVLCLFAGGALHRRLGDRAVGFFSSGIMIATTACAGILLATLAPVANDGAALHQALWPMFTVTGIEVTFGLTLDQLSAVMLAVITVVGTLIHVYATVYMRAEPSGLPRFFACLNGFVAAMLLLVLGDGFVPLLFGWEGVGVCSYLLIGFWHQRPAAGNAAMKAFVVNRVGDCGFVVAIGLLLWGLAGGAQARSTIAGIPSLGSEATPDPTVATGMGALWGLPRIGPTLGFRELALQLTPRRLPGLSPTSRANSDASESSGHLLPPPWQVRSLRTQTVAGMPLLFVVCVLLFFGAAGKSAQAPLLAWLPDAMAGPTPVSALIHAATMVTAGVYLMARLSFLFVWSPEALAVVAVIGVLTAVVGATAAVVQWDLKRVLAYSTISQLGFMFAAVGAGAFWVGIFHVVTHAFFKACLFLAAGTIVHAVAHARGHTAHNDDAFDPQDMRNMGGLAARLPRTRRAYFVACVAIAGLPVASGFYSKDAIFGALLVSETLRPIAAGLGTALMAVLILTATLTAFYMFRSYELVFFGKKSSNGQASGNEAKHGEAPRTLTAVVTALALGAIVVGPLLGWPRIFSLSHDSPWIESWLRPALAPAAPAITNPEASATVEWALAISGTLLALFGAWAARARFRSAATTGQQTSSNFARGLTAWAQAGWRFDVLYNVAVIRPALALSRAARAIDRYVFDGAVDGVAFVGVHLARVVGIFDRRVVDAAVDGVSTTALAGGRQLSRLQTGRIGTYVWGIIVGIATLTVLAYLLRS